MGTCNEFFCTVVGIVIMCATGIFLFIVLLYFAKKKIIPFLKKQSTYLVEIRKIPQRKNSEKDPNESYLHKPKTHVKQILNESEFVIMENSVDISVNDPTLNLSKQKQSPIRDKEDKYGKNEHLALKIHTNDIIPSTDTLNTQSGLLIPTFTPTNENVNSLPENNGVEKTEQTQEDEVAPSHRVENVILDGTMFYGGMRTQENTVRVVSELGTPATGTFQEKVLNQLENFKKMQIIDTIEEPEEE